jgi:hypothetical protein
LDKQANTFEIFKILEVFFILSKYNLKPCVPSK